MCMIMLGLGKHGPDGKYGAIVDVGSGSVGIAIVASDPTQQYPEVVWSHRERMVLRESASLDDSAKHITTALLNAMLTLGSEGLRALREHEKGASIDVIQVAISAPWSYTITKTVSYNQKKPFVITKKLVRELIETAQNQALEVIDESDIIKKLGLEVITRATIRLTANDYPTDAVFGQQARNLSISHVSAISQKRLLDALREGKDKVLPKTELERYSFMLIFYCVIRQLAADTTEVCLIDVTNEATEIGIVRDGILKYVTHAPYGTYSIARDISNLCGVPKEEALAFIRGNSALEDTLSAEKQAELEALMQTYEEHITNLFKRTGDTLSIPRPLFIHTDARTEPFYKERIKNAAAQATKSEHGLHLVTSKLLNGNEDSDTALLLSANFFHKLHGCDDFEQT